jgi:hypothetical protein
MRFAAMALGGLLTARCATLSTPPLRPDAYPFLQRSDVHSCLVNVLQRGLLAQSESAAFIVQVPDGYQCMLWNGAHYRSEVVFTGVLPEGVVAVVHSHPRELPHPSLHDIDTARQLNVPVFAVTPQEIWAADPTDGMVPVMHEWWSDLSATVPAEQCSPGFQSTCRNGRVVRR